MDKPNIWMKPIALGESGTTYTHQNDFPKKTFCHNCDAGKSAKLAFVYHENDDNAKNICELYDNKPGEFWPHDECSVAVYFCRKCGEAVTVWNQA